MMSLQHPVRRNDRSCKSERPRSLGAFLAFVNAAYFFFAAFFLAAFLAAFLGAAFLAAFLAPFLAAFFGAAFLAAFFAAFLAMANGFVCVKRNCVDVNVYDKALKNVPPNIVDIVDRDTDRST